jgi:uracil phosphoribosyltransferase
MAGDRQFANLHVLDHPLIQHKLSLLRDRHTDTAQFRRLLREISLLMGYEVTRDLPLERKRIETPMAAMDAAFVSGKKLAVVPILRAGTGMADGLTELVPGARVGHIGLYRDHDTKRPIEYLVSLPAAAGRRFILVDPMLATGYSAVYGIDVLNRHGVADDEIRLLTLVAAPEGMAVVNERHHGVVVYTAALDSHLDDNAYIVPGLGDAGDRLFGTR